MDDDTAKNSGDANVTISDTYGKLVKKSTVKTVKGFNQLQVPGMEKLLPGVYVVKIFSNDKTHIQRIIKK